MEFFLFVFGLAGSLLLCGAFLQLSAQASYCWGFSCCRARALGPLASVLVVPGLYGTGSVVVAHRLSCSRSSQIWDRTRVSCIGRWILYRWAIWEAPTPHSVQKSLQQSCRNWYLPDLVPRCSPPCPLLTVPTCTRHISSLPPFTLALPSVWNVLLPGSCTANSFIFFKCLLSAFKISVHLIQLLACSVLFILFNMFCFP